ncbi:GNAT family acetyltransferase [Nitzschia inconspicua]|uniref:GNAT family acetyltransferase n=1 Tax=Nitzschia inconspicua TaxID=303405 RepID=A0A9K3KYF7_9STRA|nr:GNAT family acetyltransferase [Nitzschia inconspicua]
MSAATTKMERTEWIVRPACLDDKELVNDLLWKSYSNLLNQDYDDDLLGAALPKITVAREDLLTCGTWYVVEAPTTDPSSSRESPKQLVGCGGFTLHSPTKTTCNVRSDDDETGARDVPHLRHFATDPDFARRGIASAVWNRTWNDLCHYYSATYGDDNNTSFPPAMEVYSTLTAESFYASLGFRTIKETLIPLSDDCLFPALLMKRETNTQPRGVTHS